MQIDYCFAQDRSKKVCKLREANIQKNQSFCIKEFKESNETDTSVENYGKVLTEISLLVTDWTYDGMISNSINDSINEKHKLWGR